MERIKMDEIKIINKLRKMNNVNNEELVSVWNEFAYDTLDELIIYENTEEVINEIFTPYEAVQASHNDEYATYDKYFILLNRKMKSFTYFTEDNSPIDLNILSHWILQTKRFDLIGG